MKPQTRVVKHVPLKVLLGLIRKERDQHVFHRLLFIHQLYEGAGVEKACGRMCISRQTGYTWLEQWNEQGYDRIKPRFGGGRPPKMGEGQKGTLKDKLKSKSNWLTSEVRALIQNDFGITYSTVHVSRILRSFKMHYAKPYPHDYRRPKDAREQLAAAIREVPAKITGKCVVGFLDEAAPQTTDNTSICAEHKWCLKIARQFRRSSDSGRSTNQGLSRTPPSTEPIRLGFIPSMDVKSLSLWNAQPRSTCASSSV